MYCCTHRVLPSCLHRFTEGCSRLLDCFLVCVCARARVLSCSVVSNSLWPYGLYPTKLHCPWDSTGKNTGVGCHFLLQFMKVKRESEVTQSCPTLCDPMDRSLPDSSIHGILQARVLEWGAIAFSEHVHSAIFKMDNQQGLIVQHRELCSMLCGSLEGRGI